MIEFRNSSPSPAQWENQYIGINTKTILLRSSFLFSTSLWQRVQNCKAIWRWTFWYLSLTPFHIFVPKSASLLSSTPSTILSSSQIVILKTSSRLSCFCSLLLIWSLPLYPLHHCHHNHCHHHHHHHQYDQHHYHDQIMMMTMQRRPASCLEVSLTPSSGSPTVPPIQEVASSFPHRMFKVIMQLYTPPTPRFGRCFGVFCVWFQDHLGSLSI